MKQIQQRILAGILTLALVASGFILALPKEVKAATATSKVELWVGNEQVVTLGEISLGNTYMENFSGRELYTIKVMNDLTIYGEMNDNQIDHLYIRANKSGSLTIPGVRMKGHGNLTILSYSDASEESFIWDRKVNITLDAYNAPGEAWDGYAIYTDFYDDEHDGRPSDKAHVEVMDGATHYNDEDGTIEDGASLQVNGIIKCTSFAIADLKEVNFGKATASIPYAFELNYRSDISEETGESYRSNYWEIELQQSKIRAYVSEAFCKAGTITKPDGNGGTLVKSQDFQSLWVYNEADFVTNGTLGALKSMKVMTGGSITAKNTSSLPEAVSSYFNAEGTYTKLKQEGGRITDFAKEHNNCVLNPSEDETTKYRYSYTLNEAKFVFKSTSSLLGIVGIDANTGETSVDAEAKEPSHGHFEVKAGSGIMNEKGVFWAEKGTEITFILVPDAGYQYKEGTFTCNGFPITNNKLFRKTNNIGEYVYTMGANACNISCEFEKASNEVDVNATDITNASINMLNNDLSGSMEATISEQNSSNVASSINLDSECLDADDFATPAIADRVTATQKYAAVVNVSVKQKVNTITGEKAWKNKLTKLKKLMSVSLKLDASIADNTDYKVYYIVNGKATVLASKYVSYNAKKDILTFKTYNCGTYGISFKGIKVSTDSATLYTGTEQKSVRIKATAYGSSKTAVWKSTNTKVAKVTSAGTIKAVAAGTCKVTVTIGKYKKTIKVVVKNPSVIVKNGKTKVTSCNVKVNKSVKLSVVATPTKEPVSLVKLTAAQKKYVNATLKNGNLTIKGKKKGTVVLKLKVGSIVKKFKVIVK